MKDLDVIKIADGVRVDFGKSATVVVTVKDGKVVVGSRNHLSQDENVTEIEL